MAPGARPRRTRRATTSCEEVVHSRPAVDHSTVDSPSALAASKVAPVAWP